MAVTAAGSIGGRFGWPSRGSGTSRSKPEEHVEIAPPGFLLAIEIVELLLEVSHRGQRRHNVCQGRIALRQRLLLAGEPRFKHGSGLFQEPVLLVALDDVHKEKPRFADRLPFLPQDARVDLLRRRAWRNGAWPIESRAT